MILIKKKEIEYKKSLKNKNDLFLTIFVYSMITDY